MSLKTTLELNHAQHPTPPLRQTTLTRWPQSRIRPGQLGPSLRFSQDDPLTGPRRPSLLRSAWPPELLHHLVGVAENQPRRLPAHLRENGGIGARGQHDASITSDGSSVHRSDGRRSRPAPVSPPSGWKQPQNTPLPGTLPDMRRSRPCSRPRGPFSRARTALPGSRSRAGRTATGSGPGRFARLGDRGHRAVLPAGNIEVGQDRAPPVRPGLLEPTQLRAVIPARPATSRTTRPRPPS